MKPRTIHQGQAIAVAGNPLSLARTAMVMLHGRGASAPDILALMTDFAAPELAYLAPQAAESTWYPNRFSAPLANNEPWLSSALDAVQDVLSGVAAAAFPSSRHCCLASHMGHVLRWNSPHAIRGCLVG